MMFHKTSPRLSRAVLLLALFVLTQACAAAGVGRSTTADPPPSTHAEAVRPRVKELSGCNGERFRVDLLDAIGKIPDDTLDAQREQLRDWVFTVTLARIAQRTGADEVLTGIADEPLVRDDALGHLLHMQSGPTRSTSTKSGGAIVLVEADEPQTMATQVLEAIDTEALHIGSAPSEAQVYQYVFQPEVARAEVCAMKPLSRAEIESPAQHVRGATIKTAADLEAFLAGGVDLLSAQCTEAGLEVKGRERPRTGKTPLTVEHIAALSQARGTGYVPPERFGRSFDELSKSNRATLEANAKVVDTMDQPLEIQSPAIQLVSAWKKKNPKVPTKLLWMSYELQKESYGQPGFSLDPHTSPKFAVQLLDDIIEALPNVQKAAAILRGLNATDDAEWLVDLADSTNEPFAEEAEKALVGVRAKLAKATPEEAEAILAAKLPRSLGGSLAEVFMQAVMTQSTQQCSRYDGPLFGTATGMTFFYTDLLSKLWMIDWKGVAPEGPIEGFQSLIHAQGSTNACEDTTPKNTRIWFGVRDESYARDDSGAVHFAPIATRIFAKGSNVGARHEEFEATAESQRFIAWWDDHFAEIAAWEPQYEVLNQLMKWSVVVQSSVVAKQHACFAPLDEVVVRSDRRFDKWVADTKDLRWQGPVDLLRPPKGAEPKPTDPECMVLFESQNYSACGSDRHRIAGGVGAASLAMVAGKRARAVGIPSELGRLGGGKAPVRVDAGRVRFESVSTRDGAFKNVSVESQPRKTSFSAQVDPTRSQTGRVSSWDRAAPIKQFDKSLEIAGKQVVAQQRKNGLVDAELKTSDLTAGELKVEVRRSSVLEAKAAGQKVAKLMHVDGVDFSKATAELARTRKVVQIDEGRVAWQIEVDGKKNWVIMESGSGIRGPPPRGSEASFSVGAIDGASYRPGSPLASRQPAVRMSILGESAAAPLVKGRSEISAAANDATVVAVKEQLGKGDFNAAMGALEQAPSSGARSALVDHALAEGNDANVSRVVDNAIRKGASPSELRAHGERLQTEAVLRARDGRDASTLERDVMRLGIAERRLQTAGRAEATLAGSKAPEPAVYAPASYPVAAELPPAVHPPGKLVLPDNQYVSRVIDESSARKLPAEVEVNGVKYTQRATGKDVALDWGEVGSPWRLLFSARRPVRIVMRCDDRDPAFPPCHERPSPEAMQEYEEMLKCDRDGDQHFDAPEERDCLDAQRRRKEAEKPAKSAP